MQKYAKLHYNSGIVSSAHPPFIFALLCFSNLLYTISLVSFSFVLNSNDNPRSITSKINIFSPVSDSFFTRTDEYSLKTRREASSENAACP